MAAYEDVIKDLDVLSCCLLGEYDDKGVYKIDETVSKSLVECTKLITAYTMEYLDCVAEIGEFTVNFRIKFVVDTEQSTKHAGMYLVENYKFLGKSYRVETFLAKYSDYDDNFFLGKLREVFNLATKDESEGKDIKNSIPLYEEIKKNKKALYKKIIEGLNDYNKAYVMEVLAMLKNSGELGIEIRTQLKEEIKKVKAEKNTPAYWAQIKNTLDILLYANKEKYPEETKKILDEINKRYVDIYAKIAKEAEKKAKASIKKKKKAAKKKEADDYKPYYPKVDLGKDINLQLSSNTFKFEYVKEEIPVQKGPSPKLSHKTHLPVKPVEKTNKVENQNTLLEEFAKQSSVVTDEFFATSVEIVISSEFTISNEYQTDKVVQAENIYGGDGGREA